MPFQFGLSTRAGTEALVRLLRVATEMDPRATGRPQAKNQLAAAVHEGAQSELKQVAIAASQSAANWAVSQGGTFRRR